MLKIKKGDQVRILSGNDRGKIGKVISVLPKEEKIVVEGINIKKKHARPRREGQKGEILKVPAPFSLSRVMVVCTRCGKPTRVGFKLEDGVKTRVCKSCGGDI